MLKAEDALVPRPPVRPRWHSGRGRVFGHRGPRTAGAEHPYHLAHGLLDHARHDPGAAEAAIGEARDIASPPALPAARRP
jgi:hypothetical protein